MDFIKAILVWLVMAVLLGFGLVLAAKGSFLMLILCAVAFVVMVGRIGCMPS